MNDDLMINMNTGRKIEVPQMVRMHSKETEDTQQAQQIVAVFGVECASGDIFTDGSVRCIMTSINVPEPLTSLAISAESFGENFSEALTSFQKEDPTIRVGLDHNSGQVIISGMDEPHLDNFVQRMRTEYKLDGIGKPHVIFQERFTRRAEFDYLHEEQSEGQGQYAWIIGHIEPLHPDSGTKFGFENMLATQAIPSNLLPAIEKGFKEAADSGYLIGHPVENIRIVLEDADANVDSSELAFKLAAMNAFRKCCESAEPVILEPIMSVDLDFPSEFKETVTEDIMKRKGKIIWKEKRDDHWVILAMVSLRMMCGFHTDFQLLTKGKGQLIMTYVGHSQVSEDVHTMLVNAHKAT